MKAEAGHPELAFLHRSAIVLISRIDDVKLAPITGDPVPNRMLG